MNAGISNGIFLEALFEEMTPGCHTIICGFPGDPLTAGRENWAGRPWHPGDKVPPNFDHMNSYLTVSAFEPDPETGDLRRRKANFVAMHAVMVDDVGTKVDSSQIKLPPSAAIETRSPAPRRLGLRRRFAAGTTARSKPNQHRAMCMGASTFARSGDNTGGTASREAD